MMLNEMKNFVAELEKAGFPGSTKIHVEFTETTHTTTVKLYSLKASDKI